MRIRTFLSVILGTAFLFCSCSIARQPIRGVIITGQNNHNWPVSSEALRLTLEQSGLFEMDVAVSPAAGEPMDGFRVDFSRYSLVVLDYNGDPWPETMRRAFLEYVDAGGGVIIYHAADNAFPEWEAFNRIIALGGWGGRNEKSGPYQYWKEDGLTRDDAPGTGGSHGAQHEYVLQLRRGADPSLRGSGREEPLIFTVRYGKARIFHMMLGHAGPTLEDNPAMQCAGFQTLLLRAAEWCARGRVTQPVPADFPTAERVSLRPEYR